MYVRTYQFKNINRRNEYLLLEGAFEITQSLGIYLVKKNDLTLKYDLKEKLQCFNL